MLSTKNHNFYKALPEDWHVLVADIKDSTIAISNNNHDQDNLTATGCIVAILNYLKASQNDKVPYFFLVETVPLF